MSTITKKELVERIAQSTGQKRNVVKRVVQEFLNEVVDEIGEGNRLEFRDFGVFEVCERAPRNARNPKTREPVPVPAKRAVKFKPGRRMRQGLDSLPAASGVSDVPMQSTPKKGDSAPVRARAAGEPVEPAVAEEIHVNPVLNGSPTRDTISTG